VKRVCALVVLALSTSLWVTAPAEAAKAPNTVIKSGPSGTVRSTTATFAFKAKPKRGAVLQCRLDRGRFKRCTSPVTYTNLAQGPHTFAVRAKTGQRKDKTPAIRTWTVDTVAPVVTVTDGPTGVTSDSTPTFAFTVNGPAAVACRVTGAAFTPCSSPFTPAAPLVDGPYSFEVRASDPVGNTRVASRAFEVLTPVTKDLATMQTAADYYVPATEAFDVPANCASDPRIDCPAATPLPATDQVALANTTQVVPDAVTVDQYDLTVTADVSMVATQVVKITNNAIGTCDLTVDSTAGATPTWEADVPLDFVTVSGEVRIQPGTVAVSGVEQDDLTITGGSSCALADAFKGLFVGQITDVVEAELQARFVALCAAPGPDYLGPCP
jgi:hypothetical protein